MKKIVIIFLMLSLNFDYAFSQVESKEKNFVCIADNKFTSDEFRGKQFSLNLSSNCIKLVNLRNKNESWNWKIILKNSLGDVEGSRHFCDKSDDGLIGGPAIFRMTKRKFIVFGEIGINASFSCQTLDLN